MRDTGSRGSTTFDLRRAVERADATAPRMLLCGPPVTMTGGHTWPLGGEADGVDGVRRRVRELAKAGADWIKVMATGGGTRNTMSWRASRRHEDALVLRAGAELMRLNPLRAPRPLIDTRPSPIRSG